MKVKKVVTPRMSDAAVEAKTGKTWTEWFKILDVAGAGKLTHKEIAASLHEKHNVPAWWSQMVTVGYEQARGLREKHEKPGGYEISVSKTIDAPVAKAFAAWANEKQRRRWLAGAAFTIRKATPSKSMRITWVDGKTNLDVNLYPKGGGKSQVVAQHSRLADAKQAGRMKEYWAEQFNQLKEHLER